MRPLHQREIRSGKTREWVKLVSAIVGLGCLWMVVSGAEGPQVEFSRASSTHIGEVRLTLQRLDAGTGIRYTMDGSEPTATSLEYTDPLNLRGTVQVRARAMVAQGGGSIRSETYIHLTNAPGHIQTFTSTLPILVLSTWKQAVVGSALETFAHFSLYEPVGGQARIGGLPTFSSRATMRIHGETIGGLPQYPFLLQLRGEDGSVLEGNVLNLSGAKGWLLVPPTGFDPTLIHTSLTMEMGRQIGVPTLRTRQVELYLNKGGPLATNQWLGIYLMMEVPSVANSAIGGKVPAAGEDDRVGITGDYLFETTRLEGVEGEAGFIAHGYAHRFIEPTESEFKRGVRAPQLKYLNGYFAGLDRVLASSLPKLRDPEFGYRAYLDLTNWIDCHVLETLSGNVAAFRLYSYFIKRKAGKLQRGMLSTYERAWESKEDGRDDNPRVWDTGGGLFGGAFWSGIFKDPDAWQLWLDRWARHRAGPLSLTNIYAAIDRMTNEVRVVQVREAKRWPDTAPRGSYSNEIRIMKTWISNRVEWIDRQFARSPLIQPSGGEVKAGQLVTLALPADISTNGNARIYFTRDGSDPRPAGGTNAILAELYTEPIAISTNTRIVARVVDDGRVQKNTPGTTPWSAPVAATFIVERPRLIVTEVMHHPEPPPPFMTWAAEDFGFVELMNPSQNPISLVGFHLDGSIRYQFTPQSGKTQLDPGERLVLVRNREAFALRYPEVQGIAGKYEVGLDDAARRFSIRGPLEEPVFEASYPANANRMTEGVGFSLVPRDESVHEESVVGAGYWRPSSRVGGSPGRSDPDPFPARKVLLNELFVGDGGFIELFNPSDTAVSVSGWWLTDDLLVPRKRRIPSGKAISAHGYLAIPITELVGEVSSLGYSPLGGELWLLESTPDVELSGGHDRLRYLSAPWGTSRGRRVMPDGTVLGFPLSKATPGETNPPFQTGPIVIAEVQLEPSAVARAAGLDDSFIELRNLSNHAVASEDPDFYGAVLSIGGDIEFHAPHGVSIPPGGGLVVTAFDPVGDPYSRESFERLHGRGESIVFAGPWSRRNPSVSDTLRLEWSRRILGTVDGFETQRSVEIVPIARVRGELGIDGNPGLSLARRMPANVAEVVENWTGTSPTPGAADNDLDGLADAWESGHLLNPHLAQGADGAEGDPDADGFTNEMEAYNRTEPRDPESRFGVVTLTGSGPGELVLTWAAPVGDAYVVEQLASDGTGMWSARVSGTTPKGQRTAVRLVFEPTSTALFRVRLR